MERTVGVEPTSPDWKPGAQPPIPSPRTGAASGNRTRVFAMATRRSAIELPPLIWRPHQELHLGLRLCRPLHRCSAMWSEIGWVGRSRTCDLRVNSSALLPAELLPNAMGAASITSFGEGAALKTDSPVLGMAAVSWYDHNTLLGASECGKPMCMVSRAQSIATNNTGIAKTFLQRSVISGFGSRLRLRALAQLLQIAPYLNNVLDVRSHLACSQ